SRYWANESWSFFVCGSALANATRDPGVASCSATRIPEKVRELHRCPDGAQRNPGQVYTALRIPDFAALHPGYASPETNYRSAVKAAPSIAPGCSRLPSWT